MAVRFWYGVMLMLTGALALQPAPVLATPPDVIEVQDEPFGLSKGHLYVLRTTTDNLGLYDSSRIETFLVAIDLATSAEEYWPVYRALKTTDYDDSGDDLGVVLRPDEADDLADPLAILAQRGGVPWGALYFPQGEDDLQIEQTASAFVIDPVDLPPFRLANSAFEERLVATSSDLAGQVSNYRRMSTMQTIDLFADRLVDPKTCLPQRVFRPYPPFGTAAVIAVRFTCTADEDMGTTSVIQLLPAQP